MTIEKQLEVYKKALYEIAGIDMFSLRHITEEFKNDTKKELLKQIWYDTRVARKALWEVQESETKATKRNPYR